MKILLRLFVIAAFLIGALVGYTTWQDQREEARHQERLAEQREQDRREQILSGQTPTTPPPALVSPSTEQRFRELAQRHGVTVNEFTSIDGDEAVVAVTGVGHTAVGDLLDDLIRQGLMRDFDDDMLSRNRSNTFGPNGESITSSRFTIRFQ